MAVDLVNSLPDRYVKTICCFDCLGPLLKSIDQKAEVMLLKRNPGIDLKFIFRLARALRDRDIDLLHVHNNTAFFYGAIAAKIACVKRVVYTEHGRTQKLPLKTRLLHGLLSRSVHKTVVVSDYLKDLLVKDEWFPKNRVELIPNGISNAPYTIEYDRNALRNDLGVNRDSKLVGIVARLDPIKNHSLLLRSMKTVVEKEPKARLLIVGDGPLKEKLQRETKEMNLEDSVLFTGERQDVPKILKSLDIFVLCSISEGMSLTLIEAMAAGLPIIATDVGGNPKLIRSEENGMLVPSDDSNALSKAILNLLSNNDKANSLGQNARTRYESKYCLDKMVEKYRTLFEDGL